MKRTIKTILLTVFFITSFVILSKNTQAWPRFTLFLGPKPVEVENFTPRPNIIWVSGHYKYNVFGKLVWIPGHWKRI